MGAAAGRVVVSGLIFGARLLSPKGRLEGEAVVL